MLSDHESVKEEAKDAKRAGSKPTSERDTHLFLYDGGGDFCGARKGASMTMCMSRGCQTKSHMKLLKEGKGLLPSQPTYLVVVPGSEGDNLLCYEAPMITARVD